MEAVRWRGGQAQAAGGQLVAVAELLVMRAQHCAWADLAVRMSQQRARALPSQAAAVLLHLGQTPLLWPAKQ